MTILSKEGYERNNKPVIDLTGPDGNAFVLIGRAKQWARDLEYDQEEIACLQMEMMKGDYEHLLEVFEEHFGDYCILLR